MNLAIKSLAAIALAAFIVSCSTISSPSGIDRVARIAGSAADFGTRKLLSEKPRSRAAITVTVNALRNLDASGEYDPVKFANALTNLPFSELQGPEGDLYVSTAVIIWNELSHEATAMDKTLWVKPVLKSVLDGMMRALAAKLTNAYFGPLPPMPFGMKVKLATVGEVSRVNPPPIHVLTNAVINVLVATNGEHTPDGKRIYTKVVLEWLPEDSRSYRCERYDEVAMAFTLVRRKECGTIGIKVKEEFDVCVKNEREQWRVVREGFAGGTTGRAMEDH